MGRTRCVRCVGDESVMQYNIGWSQPEVDPLRLGHFQNCFHPKVKDSLRIFLWWPPGVGHARLEEIGFFVDCAGALGVASSYLSMNEFLS